MFRLRRNAPRPNLGPSRRRFLSTGGISVAGAVASGIPLATSWGATGRGCCPQRIAAPAGIAPVTRAALAEGNRQAMLVAAKSRLVGRANEAVLEMATAIVDARLRDATLDLLRNPAPTYMLRCPTAADRQAVRQAPRRQAQSLYGVSV